MPIIQACQVAGLIISRFDEGQAFGGSRSCPWKPAGGKGVPLISGQANRRSLCWAKVLGSASRADGWWGRRVLRRGLPYVPPALVPVLTIGH